MSVGFIVLFPFLFLTLYICAVSLGPLKIPFYCLLLRSQLSLYFRSSKGNMPFWSLAAFKILLLSLIFSYFIMMCLGWISFFLFILLDFLECFEFGICCSSSFMEILNHYFLNIAFSPIPLSL